MIFIKPFVAHIAESCGQTKSTTENGPRLLRLKILGKKGLSSTLHIMQKKNDSTN